MPIKDIAIACQGGGSHAAYTGGVLPVLLAGLDNLGVARAGYDAANADTGGPVETPVLVAISGTSGGAISALLGWYGFITGGAADAERRLNQFWENNSAMKFAEWNLNHVGRALVDMASAWGWDIKSSPYAIPMYGMEWFATRIWPLMAGAFGQDNPWMRPDYFALPDLLRPGVDWTLVGALGEFASIPLEVQRWLRSHLEAAMFPPDAPCQQRHRADRDLIEQRIQRKLDAAQQVLARMDQLGVSEDALLRAAFARWRAPVPRFEPDALGELVRAVQRVTRHIPNLLLGAVELHQGEFMAFSSERAPDDGGISIDAVMASASVPWLFRAREVPALDERTLAPRQLVLWDGLFSQNPPVRNFLSGVLDDSKKPDEIWVVQINPTEAKVEAAMAGAGDIAAAARRIDFSGGEIWDLRNALAGNLALNQELAFVEAINRRMEAAPEAASAAAGADKQVAQAPTGAAARRFDKVVQVDRIIMDSHAVEVATGVPLGANSKLDRDPQLRAALVEHGRTQARRYLSLRGRVGSLCCDLAGTLAGACGSAAGLDPRESSGALCRASSVSVAENGGMVIDGATLYSIAAADPDAPQATVRWRSLDAQVDGWPVRIEGQTELADDADGGMDWRLKEVRITAVVPKPRPPQPLQPGQAVPVSAQPARRAGEARTRH